MRVGLYQGAGVDPFGSACLRDSLGVPVRDVTAAEILGGALESLDALVVPGGADLPYCQALNGAGTQAIRSFVAGGGRYLGLCAGAYFACRALSFDEGTPTAISGARELALFPAVARGPLADLAPAYDAEWASARVVRLEGGLAALYHGGPHFEADPEAAFEILGMYAGVRVAVVAASFGSGRVVLSGVHPEVTPGHLASDPCAAHLIEPLARAEAGRVRLWAKLLDRFLG